MKVTITYSYEPLWNAFGGYWATATIGGDTFKSTGTSFEEAKQRLIKQLKEANASEIAAIPAQEEVEI